MIVPKIVVGRVWQVIQFALVRLNQLPEGTLETHLAFVPATMSRKIVA